jgi:MYXO-CTERM domain-containing protein
MKREQQEDGKTGRKLPVLLLSACVALGISLWTPSARASDDKAYYYGGRVISNVEVVAVFWTGAVDPAVQGVVGPFLTAITASPYIDWLEEYDTIGRDGVVDMLPGSNQHIGRGTFSMAVTITPKNTSTSLLDSDIQTELVGQINAGTLPAPTTDGHGNVNTLYMIEFPTGYVEDIGGKYNCSAFCGYHYTLAYTGVSGTDPPLSVPYAVMPDITACGGSCGSGIEEVTSIHSHELVEAITDTEIGLLPASSTTLARPIAWYDPGDNMELADICDPFAPAAGVTGGTAVVAGYTVQLIWSNFAGACVATIPVCEGTLVQPACRPCTTYDDGVSCTGATPVCQTNATEPNVEECVACINDTTCASPTPICNLSTSTCRACTAADCHGETPLCGTSGACVQCEESNYAACTGATPICDVTSGKCVGCQSSIDCAGQTPVCNLTTNTCQACGADDDCPTGAVCDTASDAQKGACVDCNTNTDCTFGTCNVKTHTCFSPVTDAGALPPDGGPKSSAPPSAAGSGCSCRAAPTGRTELWAIGTLALAATGALRRRIHRKTGRREV